MGDTRTEWGATAGDFSNRTSLLAKEVCEPRISIRNQSKKEWISFLLLGFSSNIVKAGKVHMSGGVGVWALASLLKPKAPAVMASAPKALRQQIPPCSFSLPWKEDGPLALSFSLPHRCPTQQWPGSLHKRMSLWPGARPQTKALLELGLHPQADGTVPASPCQLGRCLNSSLVDRWLPQTKKTSLLRK